MPLLAIKSQLNPKYHFTNVSRALQNILSKFMHCRNCMSYENFMLKLSKCAQSRALGTGTIFRLEILIINVISGIVYFCEVILESLRNVSETASECWDQPRKPKQNLLTSAKIQWNATFVVKSSSWSSWNFQSGHTYKVSAWKAHNKYDFRNT